MLTIGKWTSEMHVCQSKVLEVPDDTTSSCIISVE